MCTRNEVTSGLRLAMNHRLSGIISIEHSIFRNWTNQNGRVILRLAGCTNRASNYLHYICKRSSTSEQAIICFGVTAENKTHMLSARMSTRRWTVIYGILKLKIS